jgi:nitronate monooxygenase
MGILDELVHPIVLAPLAGGPSTPELVAAVAACGAFAFQPAGYLTAVALADQLAAVRSRTTAAVGVNVFVPGEPTNDPARVAAYARRLQPEADRHGVELGAPLFDDDHWNAKVELLLDDPTPVVSFTFGCPSADLVRAFHDRHKEVWVTVTTAAEAGEAEARGADALVAQGIEAGGHRGTWRDGDEDDVGDGVGVLALVQLLHATTGVPIVATGGIMTGAAVRAVTTAGATAAALGSAFLRCPEAGTSEVHRRALAAASEPTALTRAFTGRRARGIRNRMLDTYGPDAPVAYPEVNALTAPLRRAGRATGDGDVVNLWAGQAYPLAREAPAAAVVDDLLA